MAGAGNMGRGAEGRGQGAGGRGQGTGGGAPLEHETIEGDQSLSVTEQAKGNNLVASKEINILKNFGIEHLILGRAKCRSGKVNIPLGEIRMYKQAYNLKSKISMNYNDHI